MDETTYDFSAYDDSGYNFADPADFSGYDFGGSLAQDSSGSGNQTYTYDDGSTLTVDASGNPIGSTESTDASVAGNSVAMNSALSWVSRNLGGTAAKAFQQMLNSPGATLGTAIMGAKAIYDQMNKEGGGYNKPVPKLEMVRQQVQYTDPNRRPGESGRQYFTDPRFAPQGNTAAAQAASAEQAAGLQAAYQAKPAPAPNPYAGKMNLSYSRPAAAPAQVPAQPAALPQIPAQLNEQGGIGMAQGGIADAGRYLQGKTDGMADEIPTSIDGEQPAALSHGEFVIPADVVSHLGNGNSDAGAQKLYEMMDRIRMARTGTKKQGKEIDPDEFTMGGLAAAYAGGGAVKGYDNGGVVAPTATAAPTGLGGVPLDTSKTSTLSPWVGDYVTNALGQGAALAAAPYQAYTGPLTAGPSNLQQQAFAGASEIAGAGYTPTQFTGGIFDTQAAQKYMNPYLSAALDPQMKELKRQADIARLDDATRLTKAGAYGGSRQAIMESEGRRNLLDKQSGVLGTGYATAYDKAMAQFNADQARQMEAQKATEASRQFGGEFGLRSVGQLADLGAQERAITGEGMAADKAQFEEQRDWAYKMPQYQLNLLQGLPIGAQTSTTDQTGLSAIQSNISGLGALYKQLAALGQTSST